MAILLNSRRANNMEQFIQQNQAFIVLLTLWSIPWKGMALWKSSKLNKKPWFIVLLITNTLGILEILYLYVFSKEKKTEEIKPLQQ